MGMTTKVACAAILVLTTLNAEASAPHAEATARLQVRVSPLVSFVPADIYIYVTIEPRQENRVVRVSAESNQFFRSSDKQLDGTAAPRLTIIRYPGMPAGANDIKVRVFDAAGHVVENASAQSSVM